ncbi:MAG: hypothetical protein WAV18_30565 [Roseiarcus sp.]
MATHPGSVANFPLRRRDPLVRPILQRLAAQKPHLIDEPLFGRVRLPEVSVQVPHRPTIDANLSRKLGWD